jgi:hypothetical protein
MASIDDDVHHGKVGYEEYTPHSTGSMTSIKQALSTEMYADLSHFDIVSPYGLDARLSLIVCTSEAMTIPSMLFTDQAIATTIVVQWYITDVLQVLFWRHHLHIGDAKRDVGV